MQVIAMHGWAGDRRCWDPWREAAEARGWTWQSGERGYGCLPPAEPSWVDGHASPLELKVVIGHSYGPHMLPTALLARADAVVLLASFGRFVPAGRPGRRLQAALAAMAQQLQKPEAETMLAAFLAKAAAPADPSPLGKTVLDAPLSGAGRERLAADLAGLKACSDLPGGFPKQAPVLLVEAGQDQIVAPEASAALRSSLPAADWLLFQGAGHCLLGTPALAMVLRWLEALA